jgi:hypothetical protein
MSNHKATPEQWSADRYDWSKADTEAMTGDSAFRCILELRDRVMALEAQGRNYPETPDSSTPPLVATDEELRAAWSAPGTNLDAFRAIYDLGVAHGQARSQKVAELAPVAGGLVKRVDDVISDETGHVATIEARAAILEVARWMREQGFKNAAHLLEQEAGR